MPDTTTTPQRRGRPATGTAMSSTERSRLLHEKAQRVYEKAFHPGRPLQDVSDSALLLAFAAEYRRRDGERLLVRYARELLLRAGTPLAALASLEDHYRISVDSTDSDTVDTTIIVDVTDSVETTDYQADSLAVETTITEAPLTVESTDTAPAAAINPVETTAFTLAPAAPDARSALIARIRQMKAQGHTSAQIAAALNADSTPTFSGRGIWRDGTIRNLLRSPDAP